MQKFRQEILSFYKKEGRHLPWRETLDPYKILVSEIMLQQTQVDRVIPFYKKFIKQFPDFPSLASASDRTVLIAWQGLGYNRRALYLKRIAQIVLKEYNGKLPQEAGDLIKLPGIGKGTVGSLQAFAFNLPSVFIETNIRRTFIHFFFPKQVLVSDKVLLKLIEKNLDYKNPRYWYSALMDYGTMLSKKFENPNRRSSSYKRQVPFKGSRRELRGRILRSLLNHPKWSINRVAYEIGASEVLVGEVISVLKKEGFKL